MKALHPFEASVLVALAHLPAGDGSAVELLERLEAAEAKEIGQAIVAPNIEKAKVSDAAKSTARVLIRNATTPSDAPDYETPLAARRFTSR